MRRLLAMLLLPTAACAQTPILLALRQSNWAHAQLLAAANPDPLAATLVTFIRLLDQGQAGAAEIAGFMANHPDWPDRATLERRYGEALTGEANATVAAALCRTHPPQAATALLRCADAYATQPDGAAVARAARTAWVTGLALPEQEAAFLARWSAAPTGVDQWARFEHLEVSDAAAASRQVPRLNPSLRALATARLRLRQNDPDALASLAAVPAGQHADPALLLAEARYLRRSHAELAALAIWRSALPAAEAGVSAARRPAFWGERDALARRLLDSGDAADAAALADDPGLPAESAIEANFLAGWIALRRLHDPVRARARFAALAAISHSAISQARAYYWVGRAAADPAAAQAAYMKASAWPLTYYGELALRAAGANETALQARIAAARDPATSPSEQAAFAQSEPARAAMILAGWQDPRRAADFLLQAVQPPATLTTRALAAALALRLALPDVAVQAARLAGRDGGVLPQSGWPVPVHPPVDPAAQALALAVMRQESSFDPMVVSHAGAAGLMQLMPGTAEQMAHALRAPAGPLADPGVNMRLGTAYLAGLLARFHGDVACAVAAYNAGPNRVDAWMASPAGGGQDHDAAIDWIELIPFAETRNYVQRVLENAVVYAGR